MTVTGASAEPKDISGSGPGLRSSSGVADAALPLMSGKVAAATRLAAMKLRRFMVILHRFELEVLRPPAA
jgi:hypothetical protein